MNQEIQYIMGYRKMSDIEQESWPDEENTCLTLKPSYERRIKQLIKDPMLYASRKRLNATLRYLKERKRHPEIIHLLKERLKIPGKLNRSWEEINAIHMKELKEYTLELELISGSSTKKAAKKRITLKKKIVKLNKLGYT
jgi:hypothetical protein